MRYRVTATIAWGKRPVPYRTRKLRPTAPMVLHSGGCGRVGHRRAYFAEGPEIISGPSMFNLDPADGDSKPRSIPLRYFGSGLAVLPLVSLLDAVPTRYQRDAC